MLKSWKIWWKWCTHNLQRRWRVFGTPPRWGSPSHVVVLGWGLVYLVTIVGCNRKVQVTVRTWAKHRKRLKKSENCVLTDGSFARSYQPYLFVHICLPPTIAQWNGWNVELLSTSFNNATAGGAATLKIRNKLEFLFA